LNVNRKILDSLLLIVNRERRQLPFRVDGTRLEKRNVFTPLLCP